MKKNGILWSIISAIKDPEREFIERVYLALTIVSEIAVFIALIGDIGTKENPVEIAVIVGTLIFVPSLMIICLRKERIQLAIKITVICLIFVILPLLFFFGGGIEGGGVLWIIFSFTYAGLVMTGTWRNVIFVLLLILSSSWYIIGYYHPELVQTHSRKAFYVDTYISIILVGVVCFAMTWLVNRLFKGENYRARVAAEKAEELTKAQNRFFSSMSHEIRTPINSILGLNELILRDRNASDEILKDAAGIQGSGKMLLALINDILDFSKMEAGSMDIVQVNYHVSEMLSEIVNMIWIRAYDKGLKFNVSIDPKVPSVLYGDEVRIKQILINILNNAVKYTEEGSVELHIESEVKDEKTVELSFSISDTGIGIKKESVPYLFDTFKRVEEEKNRYIEGTGLGLSIVKQLVELMGGTVTVNSVYGVGSTFVVHLRQGITDATQIGELSIHNQRHTGRKKYESSFRAPDAKILIVDDNEMNLEVEAKLLADTEMTVIKATSGKTALEYCLRERYDAILMDHLMPEMDGIACFEAIRQQVGGLNRSTPVIVLTANAGSENKEMYKNVGFDGYLVKPVSGEKLEKTLMRYLFSEKMIMHNHTMAGANEEINTASEYSGKLSVLITSTSMCDLPDGLYDTIIPVLPFSIKTEEGVFKDGIQMGADELIRYINSGKKAESMPPDEEAYRDFFSKQLKRAHHIIHIAMTTSVSADYRAAVEAARSFDNVTVINSECLSSAMGILVLIAIKLAQMNFPVEDIVSELDVVKKRLRCSFIIDSTEYMLRKGLVTSGVDRLARSLTLHPCLKIQDDVMSVDSMWVGNVRRAYKKYIAKSFPRDVIPELDVVFITYVDVPIKTLKWIKDEISKKAHFDHIVFKQASAAISANCGSGTIGIFYYVKTDKSYNLSTYFKNEEMMAESMLIDPEFDDYESLIQEERILIEDREDKIENSEEKLDVSEEAADKWYNTIPGIDGHAAIKNSGSERAFISVLKIFYDSIDSKSEELDKYLNEQDLKNYTIKVHGLKSSCKLIGALETADKAQLLESAGKEGNIDFIRENHASFIEEYKSYKEALSEYCQEKKTDSGDENDKPLADDNLLKTAYERLHEGADAMDCDAIEDVLAELEPYSIPEGDREKLEAIVEKAGEFDYQGILTILDER